MKSREVLIQFNRRQADKKRRRVMQIKATIAEFESMAASLDHEIRVEQERVGICDPTHFAYPTYAKALLARRDNLKRSMDELKSQLEAEQEALVDASNDLKKVELLDERNQMRRRLRANAVPGGANEPTPTARPGPAAALPPILTAARLALVWTT
jgi:flagellar export protein FliJ